MSRTLYTGQSGVCSIGTVDYKVTKWSAKLAIDKLDVTATSSGGWKEYLAGGLKTLTGDMEAVFDSTNTTASSALPTPFTDTQVAFSLTLGTSAHTLTFTGQVYDMTVDNDVTKAVMIKCSFESSGAVVYS